MLWAMSDWPHEMGDPGTGEEAVVYHVDVAPDQFPGLPFHHRRQLIVGILRGETDRYLTPHGRFRDEHGIRSKKDLDIRATEVCRFQENVTDSLDVGDVGGSRDQRARQIRDLLELTVGGNRHGGFLRHTTGLGDGKVSLAPDEICRTRCAYIDQVRLAPLESGA